MTPAQWAHIPLPSGPKAASYTCHSLAYPLVGQGSLPSSPTLAVSDE